MRGEYTALLKQDGDRWIGWIEEVPGVNCQERTRDELLESLRETLKEALAFNREARFARQTPAIAKSSSPYETAGFAGAPDAAIVRGGKIPRRGGGRGGQDKGKDAARRRNPYSSKFSNHKRRDFRSAGAWLKSGRVNGGGSGRGLARFPTKMRVPPTKNAKKAEN